MGENVKPPQIEWLNGVGLAAKQLCSLVYVSGLEPARAKSLYIDPVLAPFDLDLTTGIRFDSSSRYSHRFRVVVGHR